MKQLPNFIKILLIILVVFSININVVFAKQNYYAESLGVSTYNTDTNYQDKTTLTFTPDDNSTYMIIASWLMNENLLSYGVKAKLTRTTGTAKDFNELGYLPKDTTDWIAGGTVGIDTFGSSPGSQTYKIQYGTSHTLRTASIKEAKIIAIKLHSYDKSVQSEDRTTTTSTSFVDKLSGTFTPEAAGDYIIIATATGDGASTSYDFKIQLDIDGTTYNTVNIEPTNASDRYPWIAVKKVNLTQASHTVKIKYATENASHAAGIAHARIVALRADLFSNNYYAESEVRATTTSTSYQDQTTLTQTPLAGDHLIIGNVNIDASTSTYSAYGQLIKDATSYGEMLIESKDSTNQGYPYFAIKKETLTNSSTTWKVQYKSEGGSITVGAKDARIIVLDLAESVNGVCGSADGNIFTSIPTTNLCSAGNASSVSGTGPWTWTCDGINGGTTDSCSADILQIDNWIYRKSITINNSSGSTLTDYQVKIDVTYDSDMQADFDDLIFTTSDESTLIDYWLESKTDSTTATVWVEVPSLATGDNTIYMYYGNNSATSISNGANTFTFFDDFPGSSLDASKWNTTGDSPTVSSGIATVKTTTGTYTYIETDTTHAADYALRSRLKSKHFGNTNGLSYCTEALQWYGTGGDQYNGSNFAYYNSYGGNHFAYNGSNEEQTAMDGWSADTYAILDVMRNSTTSVIFKVNNSNQKTLSNYPASGAGAIRFNTFEENNSEINLDWVLVRKYTATEPTVTINSKEAVVRPNGVCGSANEGEFSSAPTENLCSIGDASELSGAGPWTWTCSVLSSWSKRKAITLTNSSGSILTNYQVKIDVTYDSDMQADFDDIRFTGLDDATQLNYWLESKTDSSTATFWVKVPSLAVGDTTIYMYYGNGTASSQSNGDNTFIQWHGLATASFQDPYVCTGPFVYEAYVKETSDGRLGFGLSNTELPGDDDTAYIYTYTYRYIYSVNNTYTTSKNESPALTTDVYVKLKIIHTGTSVDAYIDDDQIGSTITTNIPDEAMGLMLYVSTGSATHDWSFVRKYTVTEPTVSSWGTEEDDSSTPASCSASKIVNNDGVCDPLTNGTTVASEPTTNLCTTGTASAVSGSGPWNWTCAVTEEFTDPIVNGSFDGTWTGWSTSGGSSTRIVDDTNPYSGTYNAYINYNLTCSKEEIYQSVTVPNVEGTINLEFWEKTWMETWGGYGGVEINNSCVWCVSYGDADRRNITTNWAKKTIDVSAYKGQTIKIGIVFYDSHPTNCDNGDHHGWVKIDEMELVTTGDVILGEIDSCYANESGTKVNGTCGSANYTTVSSEPTTNLCSAGTISSVTTSSTTYTWTCSGIDGGSNESCVANMDGEVTNGFCGSSDRQYFISIPATNLCSAGAPSSILGSGPWLWTCNGVGTGSTNDACVGNKTMPRWRETSPL